MSEIWSGPVNISVASGGVAPTPTPTPTPTNITDILKKYWWVILIVAVAIIAIAVLATRKS